LPRLRGKISLKFQVLFFSLAKACGEMSRRDDAIVAWHEVPGKAPPQKNRPVGYGVILADVCTESIENAFGADMSGIAKQVGNDTQMAWRRLRPCPSLYLAASGNGPFREQQLEPRSDLSRRVFSLPKEALRTSRREIPLGLAALDHTIIPYPTGRFFLRTLSQALRARLRSVCPTGRLAEASQQVG
jgi:hypothetical protein